MRLYRLIYASRPFGFDLAMLGGILLSARRNNRRDGVTGALVCRADLYLQLLEGPEPAVKATFARIGDDDRHVDVVPLVASRVASRLFPEWDMLDDPARSWLWSPAEVASGAVNAASPEAVAAVFDRIAGARELLPGAAGASDGPACPAGATA